MSYYCYNCGMNMAEYNCYSCKNCGSKYCNKCAAKIGFKCPTCNEKLNNQ